MNMFQQEQDEDMTCPIETLFASPGHLYYTPHRSVRDTRNQQTQTEEYTPLSTAAQNPIISKTIKPSNEPDIREYCVDTKITQTCLVIYCRIEDATQRFVPLSRIEELPYFHSHPVQFPIHLFIRFLYNIYTNPNSHTFLLSFPSKPWMSGKTVYSYIQNILNIILHCINKTLVAIYPCNPQHFIAHVPFSPEKSQDLFQSILLQFSSLSPQTPDQSKLLEQIRSAIYCSRILEFYTSS